MWHAAVGTTIETWTKYCIAAPNFHDVASTQSIQLTNNNSVAYDVSLYSKRLHQQIKYKSFRYLSYCCNYKQLNWSLFICACELISDAKFLDWKFNLSEVIEFQCVQCAKMYAHRTLRFPQNENVAKFIQNLLESDENSEAGILKVSEIEKFEKKTSSNM